MSYEDALEAMRSRPVAPAPFEGVREKAQARVELPKKAFRVAHVATMLAALGFGVLFIHPLFSSDPSWAGKGMAWPKTLVNLQFAALLPLSVLGWAVRWIRKPKLGPQLLTRAVWWSNLVVGLLVAFNYSDVLARASGVVIALSCAVALRAVEERGLDIREPDHPFAPVRFRGHLLLALVMAAADALTLSFSALLQLRFGMAGWNVGAAVSYAGPTLLAAAVMGVAVWGVYRLRTWALFLNLIANITIAYLALEGTLKLSPSVSLTLATTAAVQSFIPVPILAVALGDREAGQPLISRIRVHIMRFALIVLALISLPLAMVGGTDGWVDGPGRSFIRGVARTSQTARVRKYLDAQNDDLRGRNFSGKRIRHVDFSGADLRDANLISVEATGARFEGADLRGADFRRAYFGVGATGGSLKGAKLQGADFTGAVTTEELWAPFDPADLEGVRCPDGTLASPTTGCDGKLGLFPAGYSLGFRSFGDGETCGREDGVEVRASTFERVGPLRVGGRSYVMLANGGLMSLSATLIPDADGAWIERSLLIHKRNWGERKPCDYRLVPLDPEVSITPLGDAGSLDRLR